MADATPIEGEFDYIIVGAGSAGCVLANRLSADPSNRVLLLEAGGNDNWIWFHIPVGYLFAIGNPRADWMFKTEPEPGLNGRSLNYPRGKVIGGSSAINGMIYMLRPGRRLRPLASARAAGLVVGRRAAVFPQARRSFAESEHTPRRRMARRRAAAVSGKFSKHSVKRASSTASRTCRISTPATTRASATSTSTRSAAGAGRPRAGFLKPVLHRQNLRLETGCLAEALFSTASARPACAGGRTGVARGALPRRNHPLRRRDRLAASADAVGHRAGGAFVEHRHSTRPRQARRRRQPARIICSCA